MIDDLTGLPELPVGQRWCVGSYPSYNEENDSYETQYAVYIEEKTYSGHPAEFKTVKHCFKKDKIIMTQSATRDQWTSLASEDISRDSSEVTNASIKKAALRLIEKKKAKDKEQQRLNELLGAYPPKKLGSIHG